MSTTTKFTNDLLTKQLTQLKDEALKPMSIIEIKEKFNLSFPFKVKRVKDSNINTDTPQLYPVGFVYLIFKIESLDHGYIANTPLPDPTKSEWTVSQSAEIQDYILYEEN